MPKEDPAAHLEPPDMSRYWYPPGKTEPELRPEFANEPADKQDGQGVKADEYADEPAAKKVAKKK